jgi:DNA-binding CsgD family transcriptional regulator
MLVTRERLMTELSLPGHLLIWASPGSGKSTLLRQWVEHSLESELHAALVDGRSATQLRTALASRGSIEVLVVDNAEAVGSRLRATLAELLEGDQTPRLIVAGRSDPFPASPARWIATRELRTVDLAFTREEFATLLAARGIALAPETELGLHERIDGWATGAALATHVLADHADADALARDFAGDHRAIGDYLLGEVLGGLGDDEREVLLACAVRGRVTPGFAVAVTGNPDAATVLDALARRNLLLEVRRDGDVVYHPVLRAYLVAESRRAAPEDRMRRYRRACAWCLDAGLPSEALEHALAAGDPETVAGVLRMRGVELVLRGDARVAEAVAVVAASEPRLATTLLRLAEAPHLLGVDSGEPLGELDETTPALAVVAEALRALWEGRPPAVHVDGYAVLPDERAAAHLDSFVRARLAVLSASDLADRGIALEALLRQVELVDDAGYAGLRLAVMESVLTLAMGTPQWRTAEPLLLAAIRRPLAPDMLVGEAGSRLLILVACLAYLRAQPLPEQVEAVLLSSAFARQHPEPHRRARAVALLDALGMAPSREALQRFDAFAMESATDPDFLSFVLVPWLSAAVHLASHPMVAAIRCRTGQAFGPGALETALVEFVAEPCRDSEQALRAAIARGAPSWDPMTLVHAHLRLAVHADAHGSSAKTLADLTEAVMLASHFRAVRPFLLFDGDAVPLLAAEADRLGGWRDAAVELLTRCRELRGAGDASVLALLSPRERVLLDELPVHQTIADIARHQQVSPNTIKSQLKSMYRKLGVESRAEAVEACRAAGLLG